MVTPSRLPDGLPPEVSAEIATARAAGLYAGVAYAVGDAANVQVQGAAGWAALEPRPVPMTVDGVFDLASVTKVVATTTACALCLERGLLDVTAPICEVLPEVPCRGQACPRVLDLATHTSGYGADHAESGLTGEALLGTILATPPQAAPGVRYEYSCRNFLLLGLIVERLVGMDLGTFFETHIGTPLGLRDTRFGPLPAESRVVATEQPSGTISDGQARRAGRPVGNAGLFSTAADLARVCRLWLNQGEVDGIRLLAPQTVVWMTARRSPVELPARGFGWDLRPSAMSPSRPTRFSSSAFGHGGWTGTSVWIDPVRERFAIVLTNRNHPRANAPAKERSDQARGRLADLLLGHPEVAWMEP